jgi:hypothetical protein
MTKLQPIRRVLRASLLFFCSLDSPLTVVRLNLDTERASKLAVGCNAVLGLYLPYPHADKEHDERSERLSPQNINPLPQAVKTDAFNDHTHPLCNSLRRDLRSYAVSKFCSSSVTLRLPVCTNLACQAAAVN